MPTGKQKSRAVKNPKKNKISKGSTKKIGLVSKYPRAFIYIGALFIVTGIYLLITGIQNNAKFGLAMISLFVGGMTVILANFSLPKKAVKSIKS